MIIFKYFFSILDFIFSVFILPIYAARFGNR